MSRRIKNVLIDGVMYCQYDVDSEGRSPNMPIETRVLVCPLQEYGTIKYQRLHYDGEESFFGNVIVKLDSGNYAALNCWQCKKV